MSLCMEMNLADLPFGVSQQLARWLNKKENWHNGIFVVEGGSERPSTSSAPQQTSAPAVYKLTAGEANKYAAMEAPGAAMLRQLGNRGQTVGSFMSRLSALAKLHHNGGGAEMDRPQLMLGRKFCKLIWSRPEQVVVSVYGPQKRELQLVCKVSSFPTARFQWLRDEKPVEGATNRTLYIRRCGRCSAHPDITYRCRAWNCIEEGEEWSTAYRCNGKEYESELLSDPVDLDKFAIKDNGESCEICSGRSQLENVYRLTGVSAASSNQPAAGSGNAQNESGRNNAPIRVFDNNARDDAAMLTTTVGEQLVAADKVALIISNRGYEPSAPNLITPHCDAEALADALQRMHFKTVTVGDLRLDEMRWILLEYKRLLGDGVYAIFYFVGHGFEVNGECYLLPVGGPPGDNYGPEHCVSVRWIMDAYKNVHPALSLILLDICRRQPAHPQRFHSSTTQAIANSRKGSEVRVNRNTVYGYATSGGVGAYEVRGDANGVFMKYLKRRIDQPKPVYDMLRRVFRDIEKDEQVCDVQIPELHTNLTKPRTLLDSLVVDGHTTSYNHHTLHWCNMHELPSPMHVDFPAQRLTITVWFEYCGHFTNKVYVFSGVGEMAVNNNDNESGGEETNSLGKGERDPRSPKGPASSYYLAFLRFGEELEASPPRVCMDSQEGISLCIMLSHLQRCMGGTIRCRIELRKRQKEDEEERRKSQNGGEPAEPLKDDDIVEAANVGEVVATRTITLSDVLITKLERRGG